MSAYEAFGVVEKGAVKGVGSIYHAVAGGIGDAIGQAGGNKALKMSGEGKKVRARALGRVSGAAFMHPHAAGYTALASPFALSAASVAADSQASKVKKSLRDAHEAFWEN